MKDTASSRRRLAAILSWRFAALLLLGTIGALCWCGQYSEAADSAPTPLLADGRPVDWWFVFKFNTKSFPGCGETQPRTCPFGGDIQNYSFSQQFVYASSENATLQKGNGCVGATATDPVGATFAAIYNSDLHFVVWNDQFYDDPRIVGCTTSCSGPWGHSKGLLAWNDAGEGVVLQVTTPSWPAAGSAQFPRRTDGNTLGCVHDDNVKVSQHFLALRLTRDDVVKLLRALNNASVVTDPHNRQLASIGGPPDIQLLVASLGSKSTSKAATKEVLSSGVILISKPSRLNVPAWQMVSSLLGSVSLRVATWWTAPAIYSTTNATNVRCWDAGLAKPGAVKIATTGRWDETQFGLRGGPGSDFNHAKF